MFNNLQQFDFNYYLKAILIFVGVFHFLLTIWAARDVYNRSNSLFFQVFSVVLTLALPVFGILFYFILRPFKTFSESKIDEIAFYMGVFACPACGACNKEEYKHCYYCGAELPKKIKCPTCKKNYQYNFNFCPFCSEKNGKN